VVKNQQENKFNVFDRYENVALDKSIYLVRFEINAFERKLT